MPGVHRWRVFLALALSLTLDLSMEEFIEVTGMDTPTLQGRFHLPHNCEPRLSAIQVDPTQRRLRVFIQCRSEHGSSVSKPLRTRAISTAEEEGE